MQNLGEFLDEKLQSQKNEHETVLPTSLKSSLSRFFIVANRVKIETLRLGSNLDHKAVVDECVQYLMKLKLFGNVLTHGYTQDRTGQVNRHLFCKSSNSSVSKIKGYPWDVIHKLIDTKNFVDMLLNYTIIEFCGSQFVQIAGNEGNLPHVPPNWAVSSRDSLNFEFEGRNCISNRPFLHKSFGKYNHRGILDCHLSVEDLREQLIASSSINDNDNNGNDAAAAAASRLTTDQDSQLRVIVEKIIRNNRKRVNYYRILNLICPIKKGKHLERETDVERVLRFVLVVLEKLLPRELYGSKRNKSKIFKYLDKLLRLPLHGSFPLSIVTPHFKLEDISWINGSKTLLESLLSWIYTKLVPQILIRFFYCTEISSDTEIVYFRREVWSGMVAEFLPLYMEKYLVLNTKCRNHSSYTLSNWNHSRPRIIPKSTKGEFRMITVPNRGFDSEENTAFTNNMFNVILPARYILLYLREKRPLRFAKLHSTADIANTMIEFKQSLLKKHGSLPKLYYMKFDIASCYDTIPREKLIKVLQKLVKNEAGFFVRAYHVFDPYKGSLKRKYTVNGTLGPKMGLNTVNIDGSKTFHFSTEEFMDTINSVLYKAVLQIGDKCYFRKDGLFQGDSLSSLLVDIFYDDLLNHYSEFTPRKKHDSLVLRLADDFLVVSTDKSQIEAIKSLATEGFGKYNAAVKKEKILASGSESSESPDIIVFCALHICISKLEMIKHRSTMKITMTFTPATAELYSRLRWLLNLRLTYGTLDPRLNSASTIIDQVQNIVFNIAETMVHALEKRPLDDTEFLRFLNDITFTITRRCRPIYEGNPDFCINIHFSIVNAFLKTFMRMRSRYESIVYCLENMQKNIKRVHFASNMKL